MLGEFLSANVSTPFLLFMVKGKLLWFNVPQSSLIWFSGFGELSDEADIAFWTGILGELAQNDLPHGSLTTLSIDVLHDAISNLSALGKRFICLSRQSTGTRWCDRPRSPISTVGVSSLSSLFLGAPSRASYLVHRLLCIKPLPFVFCRVFSQALLALRVVQLHLSLTLAMKEEPTPSWGNIKM